MATKKKTAKKSAKQAAPVDPRAALDPNAANFKATLKALEDVLSKIEAPAEPAQGDLVDALLHIVFAKGLACGVGQEVLRRIDLEFVDRNEYRVTEAYEVEAQFADLGLPDLFDRCNEAQQAIAQVYNDQNGVNLEYLREATISERKNFFQRVPAITRPIGHFLNQVLALEELCFSPRSTQRVQQRLGFDPASRDTVAFVDRIRELFAPYGHIPLSVGPHPSGSKPLHDPELCPTCLLVRLAIPGKG